MRLSRTGSARPVTGRRYASIVGLLALVLLVSGACGKSDFRYVSNSKINTYLKVPADWKEFTQTDLEGAELSAARQSNQPSSLIDMLVNRQFQWRAAFDADPQPSIEHTLNLRAEEPVVEVSVRALDADERDQVSLAALRNVIFKYDQLKSQSQEALVARNLGIGGETTESFRALDEEELNYPDGVRGVRLRFVARLEGSSDFFAFDQTALVDSKAERLYVLLIRSGEAQFIRNHQLFTEIAKSFTVKPKG